MNLAKLSPGIPPDIPPDMAAQGAETIHRAFDEHHQCLRALTRRVRRRFEERDWEAAVVRHMLVTLTGRTGG